jgi:predicted Na+-dependent transporter
MIRRVLAVFEPFILALLGTVALATFFPAQERWATVAGYAADAGIVLLFFLHGAKLSREAIWDGMRNWQLHLATLSITFIVFPMLGLGLRALPFTPPEFAAGLLFLTLLPSTVQSSIAFTAIARGNVAAAVCAASFSNLIGIFVTPALVAVFMGGATGGTSWASAETILVQLLLPFIVGHLLRPWIGGFVTRHKRLLTRVDRGSILLVVYACQFFQPFDALHALRASARDRARADRPARADHGPVARRCHRPFVLWIQEEPCFRCSHGRRPLPFSPSRHRAFAGDVVPPIAAHRLRHPRAAPGN